MPNNERQSVDMQMSGGPRVAMDWRRALLGWGFLTLIVALFVGAATKGGGVAKVMGAVGLLMILGAAVTLIASWLRGKTSNDGKNVSGESRP